MLQVAVLLEVQSWEVEVLQVEASEEVQPCWPTLVVVVGGALVLKVLGVGIPAAAALQAASADWLCFLGSSSLLEMLELLELLELLEGGLLFLALLTSL